MIRLTSGYWIWHIRTNNHHFTSQCLWLLCIAQTKYGKTSVKHIFFLNMEVPSIKALGVPIVPPKFSKVIAPSTGSWDFGVDESTSWNTCHLILQVKHSVAVHSWSGKICLLCDYMQWPQSVAFYTTLLENMVSYPITGTQHTLYTGTSFPQFNFFLQLAYSRQLKSAT